MRRLDVSVALLAVLDPLRYDVCLHFGFVKTAGCATPLEEWCGGRGGRVLKEVAQHCERGSSHDIEPKQLQAPRQWTAARGNGLLAEEGEVG